MGMSRGTEAFRPGSIWLEQALILVRHLECLCTGNGKAICFGRTWVGRCGFAYNPSNFVEFHIDARGLQNRAGFLPGYWFMWSWIMALPSFRPFLQIVVEAVRVFFIFTSCLTSIYNLSVMTDPTPLFPYHSVALSFIFFSGLTPYVSLSALSRRPCYLAGCPVEGVDNGAFCSLSYLSSVALRTV